MTTRQKTIVIILLAAAGLIGWDIYAESQNNSDMISDVFQKWAKRSPILATAFGVLMGHWFLD